VKSLRLGIDLGGTGIKLAIVSDQGRVLYDAKVPTPVHSKPQDVARLLGAEASKLLARVPAKSIRGIGVGAAGDIDHLRGVVRLSPNLGWRNVPLKKLLQRHLKQPILVENDANVAAWAAYVVEAKRKVPNLMTVTLGTGVGGGLVIDGKLYRGATGSAGEIGHMTLYPNGIPCGCGNRGCLERYVGAKALVEEARQVMASGRSTLLRDLCAGDPSKLTARMVHEAALKKDALSLQLWRQKGEHLGIALASLVNILNPQWIVLSGGVSRAGTLLLQPTRQTLFARAFPTPSRNVRLVISKLDQQLGVVGAALIVP
jgi:glucokinase